MERKPKISVCVYVGIILYPSPQVIYMILDKTWLSNWTFASDSKSSSIMFGSVRVTSEMKRKQDRNYILWHEHETLLLANIQKSWLTLTILFSFWFARNDSRNFDNLMNWIAYKSPSMRYSIKFNFYFKTNFLPLIKPFLL